MPDPSSHFPFPRFKSAYIACAILLLNGLVAFVIFEGLVRVTETLAHKTVFRRGASPADLLSKNMSDLYDAYPWKADYLEDARRYFYSPDYYPYEEFRMRPYAGKTIHVREDGFRVVPDQPDRPARRLWMLGGSTTAGDGDPDWNTIPAELQKLFNARGGAAVAVYNKGVGFWVSSQELHYLVEELKQGNVPDEVIFYDGVNDVTRAQENSAAGTTHFHWMLRDFFEGGSELSNLTATRRGWPGSHLIYAVLQVLRKGLHRPIPFIPFLEKPHYKNDFIRLRDYAGWDDARKDRLAEQTADIYLDNVRFVTALSHQYHFKTHFFWQPALGSTVGRKPPSAYETSVLGADNPGSTTDLMTRVTRRVESAKAPVISLSHIFDHDTETLYLDYVHLLPTGNQKVAKTIFKDLGQ